jgi:alpha-tubulin suppressor-like RCC1 family protein
MKTTSLKLVALAVYLAGNQMEGWAAFTKDRLSLTPVAAGSLHSFALEDGEVWGWGFDWDGRLGNGLPQAYIRLQPEAVTGVVGVSAIAAGLEFTLARQTNGTVWAWGQNFFGQLGNGTHDATNAPAQVPGLSNIVALAAGFGHSLALDATGRVWGWGRNSYGQLGIADLGDALLPVQIPALSNITAICAGQNHSLAMDSSGTIWGWGANGNGQLGLGTPSNIETNPSVVSGLGSIKQLCAGRDHSIALDTNGVVWTWGRGLYGQLGVGTSVWFSSVPVCVTGLSNIASIAAGPNHNLAVDARGAVWAWGRNSAGQLGDATTNDCFTPLRLTGVTDEVVALAASEEHSLAVTKHGQVLGWGNNLDGRLGNGLATWNINPVAPTVAVFHHHYRVLVVLLSRYAVSTNYSSIVGDMNRLVAGVGRYSYGKVALSYDMVGPFLADPIADIGCDGNNAWRLRDYALAAAVARGIDLGRYAHLFIEVHDNLLPECATSQNGGVFTGGGLTNVGVTMLWPGSFNGREYNRNEVAHEFLHGYGDCIVPHLDVVGCGCNAAYQPDPHAVDGNPFCTVHTFQSAMDIMGLSGRLFDNTNTAPNVNGLYKAALGWLPAPAITTVTNSGSFDLYPLDEPTLANGRTYLLKVPVLGATPSGKPQQFALEYRKQAPIGLSPDGSFWPGVYPFLSQGGTGCDVPFAFILRTQPANPDTYDGITPLSTNTPTMLDPGGLVVQVKELNEAFARVQVTFNGSVQPRLNACCLSNGYFGFEICGIRAGAGVRVERSSGLSSTNWDSLTNFIGNGHSALWFELANTNKAAAFYRARTE